MAACCRKVLATGFSKQRHLLNLTRAVIRNRTIPGRAFSVSNPVQSLSGALRDDKGKIKDLETEALKHHDYFNVRGLVTLEELFEARCHLGHKRGCRNPFMSPYLFGNRMDMDIIDLDKTLPLLQDALNVLAHVVYRNGIILFVSRNKRSIPWIEKVAQECGEYAHCRYWVHATFVDPQAGAGQVIRLPDLVIFLSTHNSALEQHTGVRDTSKLLIPSIGIVDSNSSPQLISYPIPGNDDSPAAIQYYLHLFEQTIMIAKGRRIEDEAEQSFNPEEGSFHQTLQD